MSESAVLSPHHLGEALVARLLALTDLTEVPVHDPRRPKDTLRLGAVLGTERPPLEILAKVRLQAIEGAPRFDGMHDIDCALMFEDEVIPIELKLGETGLAPTTFAKRFVTPGTRLTHASSAVAGSMVSLLDDNGREGGERLSFGLRARSRPVRRQWLLMLREETWRVWARTPDLVTKLGTRQLAGVMTLEEVVDRVGVVRARELAVAMARESIDPWFARLHSSSAERAGAPSPALSLVVVRCRDLERSRAFYGSLGLSLRREKHGEGPTHYSAVLRDGVVLELYPYAVDRPFAPMRFGLRVARLDEIAAALGAEVSVERETRARRCVVKDPDGHTLELSSS